jgi:hypothetical protein
MASLSSSRGNRLAFVFMAGAEREAFCSDAEGASVTIQY